MPTHIHVSVGILNDALRIPQERRERIESEKAVHGLDKCFQYLLHRHCAANPQLAQSSPETARQTLAAIGNSFDSAIALIALCENTDQVERVKKIGSLMGRLRPGNKRIGEQELRPILLRVFQQLDHHFGIQPPANRPKAWLRLKVTAALSMINDSMSRRLTVIRDES